MKELFRLLFFLITLISTSSFSTDYRIPKKPKDYDFHSYQVIFINGLGVTKDGGIQYLSRGLYYDSLKNSFPTSIKIEKKKYKTSIYSHDENIENIKFDCSKSIIVGSYSWGFDLHRRLSEKIILDCGRKMDFSITIDSIAKPFFFPAPSNAILSYSCTNYFQNEGFLQGKRMANCRNHEYPADGHVYLYEKITYAYKTTEFYKVFYQ
jgi:hypothetical protein